MKNNDLKEILNLNNDLQNGKIDFYTYRSSITGISTNLDNLINFKSELYSLVDVWFELIEYTYFEHNWNKLAIEVGEFLIKGLNVFPNEILLPQNSEVINNHRLTFFNN